MEQRMNPRIRHVTFSLCTVLIAALGTQGCSTLEPLPRFRTSSSSFAPDQLPNAKRSACDLVDPTLLGAYSALKEQASRELLAGDLEPAGIVNRSASYPSIVDQVGIDTEEIHDALAEEEMDPSEEPMLDDIVYRHVVDRAYLTNALDETSELNPAVNRVSLMKEIINLLGVRYRYGGNDAVKGLDCSAFTGTIYSRALGVRLPRSSGLQFQVGDRVKKEELKIGDLVFFKTRRRRSPVSHVGIYVGESMFAHASSRRGVIISTLGEGYYNRRFVGARRVVDAKFTDAQIKMR
jgi:cell wall-associated NlpC family hydrolase